MSSISTSPFEVKTSNKFGRYLIAKKDFPAGTLLIQEAPLFAYSKFSETIQDNSRSCCISCYKAVDSRAVVKCKKCKWDFCSLDCSENHCHREEECKILSRYKIFPTKIAVQSLYLLRFEILKKKQRKKWKEVMNMASNTAVENEENNRSVHNQALAGQQFLSRCNIIVSLKYLKKVINISRINAFRIQTDKQQTFTCLYKTCCLFANSCNPNSEWHHLQGKEEQGTMGILSARDISAGEIVTICYHEESMYMGSRHRQESILERFSFSCVCTRCMDPSELNSFYSAIKCSRCPDGWLLPPQCSSKNNDFRCIDCSQSMASVEIEKIENIFQRRMIATTKGRQVWQNKQESYLLENLIINATSHYKLHPNHHLVIESIRQWISIQDFELLLTSTEESRILYEKLVNRAKRCLAIVRRFGKVSDRVELEATITNTMIRYHFKSKDLIKIEKDIDNPVEKIQIITKIVNHLFTAIQLLGYSILNDDTSTTICSMSKYYDLWKKRLLRLQESRATVWRDNHFDSRSRFQSEELAAITDSPFEVKSSEELGRYLVAKRDIPGGALIFDEAPLFVFSNYGEMTPDNEYINCIACFKQMQYDEVVACSECKWPFCSVECTQDPNHVEEECKILSKNEISPSPIAMSCFLDLLRIEILKNKKRNKWNEIMNLTSKISIEKARNNKILRKQAREAHKFFTRCNISIHLDDIQKMNNILLINTFSLNGEAGRPLRCIYRVCCLFAHNCSPNAVWYHLTDRKERGTIGILSRRDIAAGEVVDISYCGNLLPQATRRRQATILKTFCFICACPRCSDPSELNSFYSAIKCNKCPDGWLLPSACYLEDNDYRCNKCSYSKATIEVEGIEDAYRRQMLFAPVKKRFWFNREPGWKLDNLISKATSGYYLHPSHNVVIRSIQLWLSSQDFKVLLKSTKKTRILYEKIIERAERLLSVVKRFGGISDRVELDALISTAMILYHFKSKDLLTIEKDIYNPLEKIQIIAKIIKHLLTAAPLVSHTFLNENTSATICSMAKRCDVWKKRLLRCKRDIGYPF